MFTLRIAGLTFRVISVRYPMVARGKTYPFLFPVDEGNLQPASGEIDVTVTRGEEPLSKGMKKVFEGPESWTLYRDDSCDLYLWKSADRERKFLLAAQVKGGRKAVDVTCGSIWITEEDGAEAINNPLCYPLNEILVMHYLCGEGAILHAAGVVHGGKGYLFAGVSGAGKTTVSRLFAAGGEKDGEDTAVLSDDRIVVRRNRPGGFSMYGTPWPGDGGYARNESAPLAGIFFLAKDKVNRIREMTSHESLTRLLPVVSIPWYDKEALDAPLKLCGDLIEQVPCYDFRFRADGSAVEMVERLGVRL